MNEIRDHLEPLDPCDARRGHGTTALSRFCVRTVSAFLESGLAAATVRGAEWDARTLYRGMWRACTRKDFIKLVEARLRDGEVLLVRKGVL